MKKTVNVLLTLIATMILSMTLNCNISAEVTEIQELSVGGIYIVRDGQLEEIPDGLRYDMETNTLTMENFYLLSDDSLFIGGPLEYRGDRDLNIVVKGNNIIEGALDSYGDIINTGMYFTTMDNGKDINVNFSGDGVLNFKYCMHAIHGYGNDEKGNVNINISGITINSTSNIVGTNGNVSINNAVVKAGGQSGSLANGEYGIYALTNWDKDQKTKKKLSISNSIVEIKSCGLSAIECEAYDIAGLYVYWGWTSMQYRMDSNQLFAKAEKSFYTTGMGKIDEFHYNIFNYLLLTNEKKDLPAYGEKITNNTTTEAKVNTETPGKVSGVKVKNVKGKKVKLTWKKVSGAAGYQIQYATNKKFTKNLKKTTAKKNATSKKIKKLKKKKTYYFRIRAYKTVNGKKVYGAWSKVKRLKLKNRQ